MLPWPPTTNTYWRHPQKGKLAGRHLISEKGRNYRASVARIVMMQRAAHALDGLLRVDVQLEMPDRRLRDIDNLTKALFDALSHAGVWGDDSQVDDFRMRRARSEDGSLKIHRLRNSAGKAIEAGRVTIEIAQIDQSDS